MAQSKKISVMLSSRCNDRFPAGSDQTLSSIRAQLKREIEGTTLFGKQLFEVWINEDAPQPMACRTVGTLVYKPCAIAMCCWCCPMAMPAGPVVTVTSASAMRSTWKGLPPRAGRCASSPCRIFRSVIAGKLRQHVISASRRLSRNRPRSGGMVSTVEQLRDRVQEALLDAVVVLTQRGVTAAASSRFDMGQALDWTRMDFRQRKRAMETVLLQALTGGEAPVGDAYAIVPMADVNIAVFVHAIPAAFTVAAARELVGKPFLRDHEHAHLLQGAHGPLHLIACHRGATEHQATALLGFADATVVSGPFGVFVADDVQKVQFAFLANCRDASQTRHALQRFREWLDQTGEAQRLAKRAVSRARIVSVIAAELEGR